MSKKHINRLRIDRSSSPAHSVASGGRRESSIDASADLDDDAPLFPLEGKFMSSADRDHILGLPEIEREEILAERAQQVTHRQQDLMLKKAMHENSSKQKRKADAAELDNGEKRSMRPKTEKRSALDDYKRAREQKGAERDRRDTARDRRDQRSPTPQSDRDADGESEVEWAEPISNNRRGREEPPAELQDFERCRVGRSAFAKVCFYPGFEEAIRGCYARISIGMNRETGQNMYRMTQIKGEHDLRT
jgi:RNA polymerase-associated protein RTF1